jgi:hypothetical protein
MTITKVQPGRVIEVALSAAGVSDWFQLKVVRNPFETSLALFKAAADNLEASVEYVNVADPDAAQVEAIRTVQFLDDGGLKKTKIELIGGIDYLDGPLEWPIAFVRLNVTAYTAGTANLTILQPGTL